MRRQALIFLLLPVALMACSGVVVVKDGRIIVAGNNDTSYSRELLMRVVPAGDGLFGRMCVSMETVSGWTPTGMKCMNDQGLVITHANVPESRTPFDPDKPQFRHNFLEKIVSECASVSQAIAMVRAYTLPEQHNAFIHLMLADAGGDAAVLEWVDGEVKVIRRTGPVLFMTNSLLAKPNPSEPLTSRYSRGSRMLADLKDPSNASLVEVMKEISQGAIAHRKEVGTLDTNLWDIRARTLTVFYKRDFDHPRVFSLDTELAKGAHTTAYRDIFPNPVPFETAWRDENGPVPESRRQASLAKQGLK